MATLNPTAPATADDILTSGQADGYLDAEGVFVSDQMDPAPRWHPEELEVLS